MRAEKYCVLLLLCVQYHHTLAFEISSCHADAQVITYNTYHPSVLISETRPPYLSA